MFQGICYAENIEANSFFVGQKRLHYFLFTIKKILSLVKNFIKLKNVTKNDSVFFFFRSQEIVKVMFLSKQWLRK